MSIGPLESFVFPGVFTRTTNEPPLASAAGEIRYPALIGTGLEEIRVSDFAMVRGSSSIADNIMIGENVSNQFDGTSRICYVSNFPIVKGNGKGIPATLPGEVIAQVNSEQVAISAVDGISGKVTLASVPKADDEVLVSYYFKRRDTYIENEDLSVQADGTTTTFKVRSSRIVKGDNSGLSALTGDILSETTILVNGSTITVPIIKVLVNGTPASILSLNGGEAVFTLTAAPLAGSTVLINYFVNNYQDTYDILPASAVSRIVKAGLSSDTTDYSNGTDYVLTNGNRINWGHAVSVEAGITTVGNQPLNSDSIGTTLIDNRVLKIKASGTSNSINKVFALPSTPVKGDGLGIPVEDPTNGTVATSDDVIAYVGTSVATAVPAVILSIKQNEITLATAPASGSNVYVSYYENNLLDEKYTVTCLTTGGVGVGEYKVVSGFRGDVKQVLDVPGTSTVTYPEGTYSGSGAGTGTSNAQIPPSKLIGNETVTVTFDGAGNFAVTSTLSTGTGSGSVNVGVVGQTYIDEVSGFRVTFASATAGTIDFAITKKHTCGTAFQRGIYGTRFLIEGLVDVEIGDTGIISTFPRTGNEPANGDIYYVTFDQVRTDYTTKLLTTMSDVTKYFGPLSIENKIVVAANLAFLNGARAVALKQVRLNSSTGDATSQDYLDAIDSFNEPLQDGSKPSILQVLTTNIDVINYLKSSNATQSSIRYKNERTSYFGYSVGTKPSDAGQIAASVKSEKMTAIYPDGAVLALTDEFGNEVEYLVGGEYLAVAMSGRDVSPVTDIATPLTRAQLVGFRRLNRRLDTVTASQVANSGVTVLEDSRGTIRVLMSLTTDLTSVLTRNPRIVEIKHFIQKGVRDTLDPYIGTKFLPSQIPAIESSLGSYFKALKLAEIITDYKGIKAVRNASDPSTVDVTAYYSPVLSLDWIVVTLNLRSTLG